MSKLRNFKNNLKFLINDSKKPLVWLETFDYNYLIDNIKDIFSDEWEENIAIWDANRKVTDINGEPLIDDKMKLGIVIQQFLNGSLDGTRIINWQNVEYKLNLLIANVTESLFSNDGDNNLEDRLIARLQDFVYKNNKKPKQDKKTILLVSNYHFDVKGLEHLCEKISMPIPDIEDIRNELGYENGSLNENRNEYQFSSSFKYNFTENIEDLVDALNGMYLYDIKNLMLTIMSESEIGKISPLDSKLRPIKERVIEGKRQIVSNSGLLEVIELKDKNYHEHIADIDNLRDHLKREKELINNNNFLQSKLPRPKGILLVGAPGCGKSESAKAVASILDLPLYRLNIGDLLGHKYGQSENRFNDALRTADSSAPCVLWIDEIEKAFAGAGEEKNNDDTLTHIIGRFLTWMQEHETLVYLVATANNLNNMRQEFLRKGRWDDIYYLTFPTVKGRSDILQRTLERYNVKLVDKIQNNILDKENIKIISTKSKEEYITLLYKMEEWSGAEISGLILDAIKDEYRNSNNIDVRTISLSRLKKKINEILREKELEENDYHQRYLKERAKKEVLDMQLKGALKFDDNRIKGLEELLMKKYEDEASENKMQYKPYQYESRGYRSASNQTDYEKHNEDIKKLIFGNEEIENRDHKINELFKNLITNSKSDFNF